MNTKLVLKVNQEAMNKASIQAIEFFKQLECDCLHDVDLEKCVKSFLDFATIYHKEWFVLSEVIE